MDQLPSKSELKEERSEEEKPLADPSWEKWRNEQIQTISTILSNVFKVEDEARQTQTPSRLLHNPANPLGSEKEVYEKISAIRKQISEYEQMLQLSLKRIDNVLLEIHPPSPKIAEQLAPNPTKKASKLGRLKNWLKNVWGFKKNTR